MVSTSVGEDQSEETTDGADLSNETDTEFSGNGHHETDSLVNSDANITKNVARTAQTEVSGKGKHDEPNESESRSVNLERTITVDEDKAPDGGWGWFIVIGALLLRTVIGGLGRSHGLFYVKFKERFSGTATSTALVTSLTGFVRLSLGPFVSILCARFPCRVLTAFGAAVLFLGLILTAFGPSLQFLYFSYGVVTGFGRAFALTPTPILLGYYFNKKRSKAFGLASAGFSIGGFAITPIVELLFQTYGFQGTFTILSGFALNILVASALFRPIELHRKLTSRNRDSKMTNDSLEDNSVIFKSLEHIESGAVLSSSTVSINRLHVKLSDANNLSTPSLNLSTPLSGLSNRQRFDRSQNVDLHSIIPVEKQKVSDNTEQDNEIKIELSTFRNLAKPNDKASVTDNRDGAEGKNEQEHSDNEEALLHKDKGKQNNIEGSGDKSNKWLCFKRAARSRDGEKKTKLISWSVLKDTRFQCFVFATFCFTLPSSGLFLPALAKTKGVSDIQAATLLSISAGSDTVFRVLSGIILDLKVFRSNRPLIYNGVTFLQGVLTALYPSMTNYTDFMILSATDGAVQGIKNAQGTVIVMDILGVDKLASSMAVTMTVQCVAVFLGPTVSGQLIDKYGSFNGAFYFGSGAILLGGLVMAAGNIAKHCADRKTKNNSDSEIDRCR